jgi:hypothetical protein
MNDSFEIRLILAIIYITHLLCFLFFNIYLYKKTKSKYFLYILIFWLLKSVSFICIACKYEYFPIEYFRDSTDLLALVFCYYIILKKFNLTAIRQEMPEPNSPHSVQSSNQ